MKSYNLTEKGQPIGWTWQWSGTGGERRVQRWVALKAWSPGEQQSSPSPTHPRHHLLDQKQTETQRLAFHKPAGDSDAHEILRTPALRIKRQNQ